MLPDVFNLFKCKSANWREIGMQFGVEMNDRDNIARDLTYPTPENKLEAVLHKWIESECSPVTWDHVAEVLEKLEYRDLKAKIIGKFCSSVVCSCGVFVF